MNIKKKLLIAGLMSIFGLCSMMAQKTEYRESQARLAEPVMGVYIKPLIAELEIDKIAGKIKDKWEFSNKEVNALSGEVPNLKARALFMSTEKHNADVIVAASFDIVSKEDNSGYYVTVIGYPAKYVRWRTATAEDNNWIHYEKITPIRSQEATQAITK